MPNLKHINLTLVLILLVVFSSGCGLGRVSRCYKEQRVCQDHCRYETRQCKQVDEQCFLDLRYCLEQK